MRALAAAADSGRARGGHDDDEELGNGREDSRAQNFEDDRGTHRGLCLGSGSGSGGHAGQRSTTEDGQSRDSRLISTSGGQKPGLLHEILPEDVLILLQTKTRGTLALPSIAIARPHYIERAHLSQPLRRNDGGGAVAEGGLDKELFLPAEILEAPAAALVVALCNSSSSNNTRCMNRMQQQHQYHRFCKLVHLSAPSGFPGFPGTPRLLFPLPQALPQAAQASSPARQNSSAPAGADQAGAHPRTHRPTRSGMAKRVRRVLLVDLSTARAATGWPFTPRPPQPPWPFYASLPACHCQPSWSGGSCTSPCTPKRLPFPVRWTRGPSQRESHFLLHPRPSTLQPFNASPVMAGRLAARWVPACHAGQGGSRGTRATGGQGDKGTGGQGEGLWPSVCYSALSLTPSLTLALSSPMSFSFDISPGPGMAAC
ncbi:hypothetical protein LEMA_P088790.1 [Plenodomus lingam JN3]|uniref:Uncharacterized protein n=1 Tax=Leptosphaeria maculans (strain JN3 / isolate v23.1.3 / race Av1-4-5-6-7-8) TaxID=985895 RepID=E5A7P5_LEPMJ|nr:hypothetical protein LEMA_P088790.1 [Plenodomus lingam JN3]CBX99640.1 hypothetical protein LEMA_P088790.1 [Plenodomus lingam JN3]